MCFTAFRTNSFFLFFDRFIPCKASNFVGTSACCVRRVLLELCHKQISRISRNKRSICGMGEICVREKSSDTARNVPTPSLLTAHRSKSFFCRNKNENVKLFWYSLIITIRGQKRTKMRQKGVLKVPSWKKIIFQLRKNIFPTGK